MVVPCSPIEITGIAAIRAITPVAIIPARDIAVIFPFNVSWIHMNGFFGR
jgi:hypothetical protein